MGQFLQVVNMARDVTSAESPLTVNLWLCHGMRGGEAPGGLKFFIEASWCSRCDKKTEIAYS